MPQQVFREALAPTPDRPGVPQTEAQKMAAELLPKSETADWMKNMRRYRDEGAKELDRGYAEDVNKKLASFDIEHATHGRASSPESIQRQQQFSTGIDNVRKYLRGEPVDQTALQADILTVLGARDPEFGAELRALPDAVRAQRLEQILHHEDFRGAVRQGLKDTLAAENQDNVSGPLTKQKEADAAVEAKKAEIAKKQAENQAVETELHEYEAGGKHDAAIKEAQKFLNDNAVRIESEPQELKILQVELESLSNINKGDKRAANLTQELLLKSRKIAELKVFLARVGENQKLITDSAEKLKTLQGRKGAIPDEIIALSSDLQVLQSAQAESAQAVTVARQKQTDYEKGTVQNVTQIYKEAAHIYVDKMLEKVGPEISPKIAEQAERAKQKRRDELSQGVVNHYMVVETQHDRQGDRTGEPAKIKLEFKHIDQDFRDLVKDTTSGADTLYNKVIVSLNLKQADGTPYPLGPDGLPQIPDDLKQEIKAAAVVTLIKLQGENVKKDPKDPKSQGTSGVTGEDRVRMYNSVWGKAMREQHKNDPLVVKYFEGEGITGDPDGVEYKSKQEQLLSDKNPDNSEKDPKAKEKSQQALGVVFNGILILAGAGSAGLKDETASPNHP